MESVQKRALQFLIFMGMVFLLFGVLNEEYYRTDITFMGIIKRRLGIGSSPPDCRSRCNGCTPCFSVTIPINPTRTVTPMDYYPEVWRCKCRNRIFKP
ncbi:hypothetical protein SUGI_0324380 [Cryptomeria japonica]|nr:hypothetical protein SUGI_0324380 [Cryptomeria japonica]